MAVNQACLFLIFLLNGVFIGLLFDFFRILRKSFKTNNLITYIEDIIFWIISGISIIFSMHKFSGGTLRIFMFLGLMLGIIMYLLTLSNIIISFFVSIITLCIKIIKKIIKVIIKPLKSLYKVIDKSIISHFYINSIKLKSIMTKILKKRRIFRKNGE